MNNKDLENIVVISMYDGGYNYSIMINGIIYGRFGNVPQDVKNVMDKTLDNLYDNAKLKEIFPNKTIIVCDDGCTEVIE